ncbi:MAG: hypothetical protein EZS28_027424 [Streblomastix strix]|uniref:Uncharacterized protein n=1 Tax=Streblomastix strix TaxID=222440 RepID=A0A5J4V2U9_9EUKA|nr:MAG: hypothetical protein EZS28_027424 [Streblomastix strix]
MVSYIYWDLDIHYNNKITHKLISKLSGIGNWGGNQGQDGYDGVIKFYCQIGNYLYEKLQSLFGNQERVELNFGTASAGLNFGNAGGFGLPFDNIFEDVVIKIEFQLLFANISNRGFVILSVQVNEEEGIVEIQLINSLFCGFYGGGENFIGYILELLSNPGGGKAAGNGSQEEMKTFPILIYCLELSFWLEEEGKEAGNDSNNDND